MVTRVATGVPGFDKLVQGGLPKGSVTLVSGAPGTGKSILCMQALYNNAVKGKKALYVSFEQNEKDIKEQMKMFGWNSNIVGKELMVLYLDASSPDVLDQIWAEARKGKYEMLAIDSLSSLAGTPVSPDKMSNYSMAQLVETTIPVPMDEEMISRIKIKTIIDYVRKSGATSFLISEISQNSEWYSRDTISEFLSDGVIKVTHSAVGGKKMRYLEVLKMRKTKVDSDTWLLEFSKGGLAITEKVGI